MGNLEKSIVLLAEDDTFISKAFKDGMQRRGLNVEVANDGVEAMEMIQKNKPSLILLDIMMPRKDGFEVLKELRDNQEHKNIPVIILSNLGQDRDIQKAKELGANDYLVKSNTNIDEIIRKIEEYLGIED